MSDNKVDKTAVAMIVGVSIILLSIIGGVSYYLINDRNLMSKNISEAVAKGMDPLAVRCAYNNDTMCMIYAASNKK